MFDKIICPKIFFYILRIFLFSTLICTMTACGKSNLLNLSQTYHEGYLIDQAALETVPVGSSREQVLLALGTPSTKAIYDDEVFYYISQTQYRSAKFLKPKTIDRRILAIYFDPKGQVSKIAHYGLQDGQLFDFISRTTPTGGKDRSFLSQLIKGVKVAPAGIPTINEPR